MEEKSFLNWTRSPIETFSNVAKTVEQNKLGHLSDESLIFGSESGAGIAKGTPLGCFWNNSQILHCPFEVNENALAYFYM